ncbi:hypothetical protein [Palaeococcus sp. (in: euryarchaeotes)]
MSSNFYSDPVFIKVYGLNDFDNEFIFMQFDDEYPAGELFISSASLTITGFVIYKKSLWYKLR